ncbi:MAG: hypothetical protein HKN27_00140 [Silicimonas sp.]|nr:hypothetical protein [Silicimonas sp.]
MDKPVVNLGVRHAGVSLFASERWVLECASGADVAIMQVLGAGNMSNRLYSVHSRRNDRFLAVSPALKEIFPDVDFTEFSFIRHLLKSLSERSQTAFEVMVEELRFAWLQRMRRVLSMIETDVVLLWMSDRAPAAPSDWPQGPEPLFVTKAMVDDLAGEVSATVEVVAGTEGDRLEGKTYAARERGAALTAPCPHHHAKAAERLSEVIGELQPHPAARSGVRDRGHAPRSRSAI